MKILESLQTKKPKLVESRLNAVGEHIRKAKKQSQGGDQQQLARNVKKRGGGAARPKSQIDRQQKFSSFRKMKKGKADSARSKAGKAKKIVRK